MCLSAVSPRHSVSARKGSPARFQVSDPVAAEFSLNTRMYLLSKKSLWLSDGSMGFGQESDVAFAEGTVLPGGLLWM